MKYITELGKSFARRFLSLTPAGRRYYNKRKERQRRESLDALQKCGGEVLNKVHNLCVRENVSYILCFGTLIGCVRDGALMQHDDDIDFAILPQQFDLIRFVELLNAEGFSFFWAWECQGRITEFAVEYKGIHVDFYLLHDEGNHVVSHWYMPIRGIKYPNERAWSTLCVFLPKPSALVTWRFEKYGTDVIVPANYDALLSAHYGNWRVPEPNWKVAPSGGFESSNRKFLDEFGYRLSFEEMRKVWLSCLKAEKLGTVTMSGVVVPMDVDWGLLRERRERQLITLRRLVEAFDKLGLSFFLAYGGVLGVARHKGKAIPWDDDIDLIMPRDDYERGISALYANLAFDVHEYTREDEFRVAPAKVALKEIADGLTGTEKKRAYLDIFALDVKPWNGVGAYILRKIMSAFENIILYRTGNLSGWRKLCAAAISPLFPSDLKDIKRMQVRYSRPCVPCSKWKSGTLVGEVLSAYGDRVYMPWRVYQDGCLRREAFEGVNVPVPQDLDTYLTHIYGDWRKMPPIGERRPRHASVGPWFYAELREKSRK